MGIIRSTPGSTAFAGQRHAMEPPETIDVDESEVSCDGGGGALGHPRVYLRIDARGWVECPYCDRRFVLADGAPAGS